MLFPDVHSLFKVINILSVDGCLYFYNNLKLFQLRPNHDSQGQSPNPHCTVDLHIKCSENYPLSPPTVIKPVNAKGLSDELIQDLQSKLNSMAKEKVGEVMVMEIGEIS